MRSVLSSATQENGCDFSLCVYNRKVEILRSVLKRKQQLYINCTCFKILKSFISYRLQIVDGWKLERLAWFRFADG